MSRIRVWDLPTRLCHWLLAAAVAAAIISGEIGGAFIEWHGYTGLFILGLVTFRIVWGFVGSPTARFANFVRGPAAIRAYLAGQWRGVGHNPLGALAVLALLAVVAAQVFSGLLANDDINFQGPLADLVGKEWSDRSRAAHALVFDGLLVLVGLHVAAIAFYARVKKLNLVKPMLTGWQASDPQAAPPLPHRHARHDRALVAFVVASVVASTTVYAAAGGFLPPPPPPPIAAPAPAW